MQRKAAVPQQAGRAHERKNGNEGAVRAAQAEEGRHAEQGAPAAHLLCDVSICMDHIVMMAASAMVFLM